MESGIDEEWEMVDYYPPSKHEQQKPQIKWSWVIDAGKKVVIGGLVVSSLPFLLPPLVVISALALALSVPYGVVLASYACTHNLMAKLLPTSTPTPTYQDELETGFEDIKQIGDDEIRREVEEEEEGYNLDINKDVERVNEDEEMEEGDTRDDKSFFNVEKTHQIDDEIGREEEEGYDLEKVNEEEEKEESDTKPYFDVVKRDEGENLLQDKIISETKGGGEVKQNGTKEILVQDSIIKRDEKETESSVQDKIITQDEQVEEKQSGKRRKTKKYGGGKSKEAPLIVEETVIVVEDQSSKENVIQEKIEVVMVQDDSVKSTTIIADTKGTELKEEEKHIEEDQDQEAFGDDKIWAKIDAIREISGFNSPRRDSYYEELKALYLFTGIEAPSTSSHTPPDFPEFYSKLCFLMSVIGLK